MSGAPDKPAWREFFRIVGEFRGRYVLGASCLAISVFLTCSLPWVVRRAIAAYETRMSDGAVDASAVRREALIIMAVAVLMALTRVASRITVLGAGRKVCHRLRVQALSRLVDLGPSFYARKTTGELVSRLTSDVQVCHGVCAPGVLYALQALFLYVFSLAFMGSLNGRLTLVIFLPFPFLIAGVAFAAGRVRSFSKESQEALGRLSTRAQETLAGMAVVKGFVMEEREQTRFRAANDAVLAANMRQVIYRGLIGVFIGLASGLSTLVVLWYGGKLVIREELGFADFAAFFGYMGLLVQPTVYLGWVTSTFARGGPALARVQELSHAELTLTEPEDPHIAEVSGALALRDLTYRYPAPMESEDERREALREVSFELPAGGVLGLFGRVGSGKSTLLRAIPRLLEMDADRVFVDGVPVERWSLGALREGIGYVPQDGMLFSMSLADNLRLGAPEASEDELKQACELAGLGADLPDLPDGLDTLIGERGVMLSGGQRQRVAIARALLVRPRILLLDDALSMVDAETADHILRHLEEALAGVTVVVAAHRTATLLSADRILVLERGAVVEDGTPDELLQRGGFFADSHERQRLETELGAP